ncbi:uncharacterized protein LOC123501676 isoform X2 [Portunus trituberculatus]|uniref:uncharacterized protein LOC123501676 isoform X2 n=1 Tax=Portunus trituberculatus TaxID=210409 RepID=UPI001E1CD92B|nr:uncharacterized protein LOC123501676 isoform X2 [Portunus trituberculatus]
MTCGIDNKCWCFSLRRGAFIVAGTTLVLSIAGVMYGVYQLLTGFKMALATIGIEGGGVLLALLVSYGVKEEKRAALRVWEILCTILILALAGLGLFTIIKSSISVGLGMLIAAGLQVYFLAIVHAYIGSIEEMITVEE